MKGKIIFGCALMALVFGMIMVSCDPDQTLYNPDEVPLIDALQEQPEEEPEEPEEEPEEEENSGEPTGELADTSGWTIADFSSEETSGGENTGLANAIIDGDVDTYWHSCYSGDCGDAEHPHTLTVDMGAIYDMGGLELVQRQSGSRQVNEFDVEVSLDNETFTPVGSFTLEDGNLEPQAIGFEVVSAQYFKIIINSTHDGDRFAALAEVNAYVSGNPQPSGTLVEDRSEWVIAEVSSEQESGETTGLATAVLDGDVETYWHSCYSGDCADAAYPHHITIDMGNEVNLSGLQFAQRQTLSRAVNEIAIEVSTDNETFTPVGDFVLEEIADAQSVGFTAITARYVRVIMNSSYDTDRFAAMAEINAYTLD